MSAIPSFGIPRLDDAFAGPGAGRTLLLLNQPGVDGRPFLVQAAVNALEDGQAVVYVCLDRSPARAKAALREAGAPPLGRLTLLDAYSSLHGIVESEHPQLDAEDLADLIERLGDAHQAAPDALLVIDSLNGLMMRSGVSRLAAATKRLHAAWQRFPEVIAAYTQWNEELALRSLFDGFSDRVRLHGVQERIITHEYFRIERVAGRSQEGHLAAPVMYRNDGGRVRAYIPKLLVTGPGDAGKTTFIHTVCDRAVSVERSGKTVAMDRGHLERGGVEVEVFGTPGQARFDPMMGPVMAAAVGVVLVVDSTQPETFQRAMDMLRRAWRNGLQAVVAANKQDLPGAMRPETVAKHLSAPPGIPVLACQAGQAVSALSVMDELLHRILGPEVAA